MTTLKEIAQMCGVSPSTVSNILNGKPKVSEATKKRVLDVIKETGYQPNYFAQGMRKQKTRIIGVLAEDLDQFSSPGVIEGIMSYCEQRNYRTILENMRLYQRWGNTWFDQEKKYNSILKPAMQQLLSIKVDGIIYVAGHARNISCFPEDFELPGVIAYGYSRSLKFPSVVIDDEKAAYDATRYLIDKGYRKIGVITGVISNIHTQKRTLGYQKALYEERILFNPKLVLNGNWTRTSGYEAVPALLAEGITAIFCMNDIMAAGVYDYLYEHNLVPGKDISVIGYDNREPAAYLRPQLTTMEIPLMTIGEKAAEAMLDILETEDEVQTTERNLEAVEIPVDCHLVERNSVEPI